MPTPGEQLGIDIIAALRSAGFATGVPGDDAESVWKIIGEHIIAATGGGGGGSVFGSLPTQVGEVALWDNTFATLIKAANVRILRDTTDSFDVFLMQGESGAICYVWIGPNGAWKTGDALP